MWCDEFYMSWSCKMKQSILEEWGLIHEGVANGKTMEWRLDNSYRREDAHQTWEQNSRHGMSWAL